MLSEIGLFMHTSPEWQHVHTVTVDTDLEYFQSAVPDQAMQEEPERQHVHTVTVDTDLENFQTTVPDQAMQ